MTLSQQFFTSLKAAFILLILSVMICAESVLISENAAFLITQGKTHFAAFALAICVALLIPIAASYRTDTKASGANADANLWGIIGKWAFVFSLVILQVWFASQSAIAPQMASVISSTDREIMAEYKEQIRQYDTQIAEYQKRIDAYSDTYRSKKADLSKEQAGLIESRKIALSELRTVAENAGTEPEGMHAIARNTTIGATILYRLALEIGVIFLAVILRGLLNSPPLREGQGEGVFGDGNNSPSPENSGQLLPETLSAPRIFVLDQFPDAICRSANGRKGPFTVYADPSGKTLLGRSQSNVDAWVDAAQKLIKMERRAA